MKYVKHYPPVLRNRNVLGVSQKHTKDVPIAVLSCF